MGFGHDDDDLVHPSNVEEHGIDLLLASVEHEMGWARIVNTVVRDVDIPFVRQTVPGKGVVLPVTFALDAEELPLVEFVQLTIILEALHGKPVVRFDPAKHVVDHLKSKGSVEGTWRVTAFDLANPSCSAELVVEPLYRPLVLVMTGGV